MGEVVKLEQSKTWIEQAEQVIEFLNSKTGRRYPVRNPRGNPTSNADVVMHRLREGYSVADCKSVIACKVRQWAHDEKMSRYLRPDTLFRRGHFETYLGEIGGADE